MSADPVLPQSCCEVCETDAAFLRTTRPAYEAIKPAIRVVDLFCGCGGLTLGIAEAARRCRLGTTVVLAVDADEDAVAVFRRNFRGADVRQQAVEELFDGQLGTRRTTAEGTTARTVGAVDVLVGGPPCQGHSDLNNHTRRDDIRNDLYLRMARAAQVLRPSVVLIENVPAVQHDVEDVVGVAAEALERAGYRVADAILDTQALGAPQRRRRHVLLAASKEIAADPERVFDGLQTCCPEGCSRSVRWAIDDLLDVEPAALLDTPSKVTGENVRRIAYLFDEDEYDLPNRLRPACHQSDHSYRSMYGRLRWDEPAQTVTTGFGSMGQGRYVHPARRRTLTPHEAARLQMLPDFCDFGGVRSRTALATMIGNAVPPVLSMAIGEALIPALRTASAAAPGLITRAQLSSPTPAASSAEVRRRMQATRQRGTKPERAFKLAFDSRGWSYLEDTAPIASLRSRPDFLFPHPRVAVYVDGCFWHSCPQHGTMPKTNQAWWTDKLEANRRRDEEANRRLHEAGWTVIRFWAHDDPERAARQLARVLAAEDPPLTGAAT